MLWNSRFLFLHIPKTAGKSLTRYFVEAWSRPIFGLVSAGQLREVSDCNQENLNLQIGRGHETIKIAHEVLRKHDRTIQEFEAVFVCVRNPYDLMVSNYHFMRQSYRNNKDRENFALAANTNFEEFCVRIGKRGPHEWMQIDGEPLSNLKIIRFENLSSDLEKYSQELGFAHVTLPHLNPSTRGHYREYLTPLAEEHIFQKFRYWFERGYYSRESVQPSNASQSG